MTVLDVRRGAETLAGRYLIDGELGRGGTGRVLRVHDRFGIRARGMPLAAKVLEDPAQRDDFVREYERARELAHPAFVEPMALLRLRHTGRLFEPTPGRGADSRSEVARSDAGLCALYALAEGRPLSPELAPQLALSLAHLLMSAVDHLHRAGLVHGDLAPANVLWKSTPELGLTILDLGAGGRLGERAGSTRGVLAYAAPERLSGAPLSAASDLWSVGALIYGLAHGRHPLPGYPARVGTLAPPETPHILDPWLTRLLAIDPDERHPSAAAALAELEALGTHLAAPIPRWPRIEPRELWTRIERHVLEGLRRKRPLFVDIVGAPGSGRSTTLWALGDRLAAQGVLVVEVPIQDGRPETWLADVLTALGWTDVTGGEATLLTSLGRAVLAVNSPVCLLVDDLGSAPQLMATLARLAHAAHAVPENFGPLAVLGVGLGLERPEPLRVDVLPWTMGDVATLLSATWPGRNTMEADLLELVSVSRGTPGLLTATLEAALTHGALTVDSTALTFRRAALPTLAPSSFESVARDTLFALPEGLKRLAVLSAHTPFPLPGAEALVEAGVGVMVGGGVRLASESLARAARELVADTRPIHATLAERFAGTPRALGHRVLAGLVPDVDTLLDGVGSDESSAFLLDALARQPGWPGTAGAALAAARLREAQGQLEQARLLFARAGELAARDGDELVAATAAHGEGRLETRLGRYPAALAAFERALDKAPASRHELEAGRARAAVLSGRIDLAREVADASLASPDVSPAVAARLLYVRALVDWYRGDFDAAEPRLVDALAAAREANDLVEQAAIVTAQGLVAHRRGELPRASSFYAEALALGQKAHDEGRVLTALQNLGVIRHELGQWTEALDTYRHALTLAEAQDARAKVTQIAGNLGNLWRYLGETEKATQVLERGYELAVADGNHHLESLIANLLGDVESDKGELSAAQRHYQEANAVALEHGFEPERLESALNLSRLLCERLDLDQAETVLQTARELAVRHDALAIQLAAAAAQLARRRGKDTEAKALIDEALAGVERLKNPDQRWPIFLEAALIARDREDLASAETWSREVRRVLQAQLDQVPGRHREAFSQRRDRRSAMRETAIYLADKKESKQPRALGWSRLLEVHKRLAGEHNVQRLLEYIMDSAILLTGAERGFLLLDDETHKEGLEVKVARNLDQENIRNRHLKISRGIARRVITTGEPVVTIDAMEDERYREQLSVVDLRLRSILCLPMSLRGRVLGAIYLDNRFRTSAFSDEDIGFMEAFADMAAIALDNARLLESLENQTKEMAVARKEIEALNERLASELSRRTQELEDTRVAILEERRNQSQLFGFENIIGAATNMRRIFQVIERLKNTDIAVLIEGESGTGKELVARAIHFAGVRKDRPFVAVNCGAIPATLLESELFGHVRGAFTNATSDKKGLFEVAHTGTLFLDEIGEMPLEMQVKLLRVLQSGEIQKVGATKQVTVDVRIVAATNRRLEEEVKEGRFREDLFYRLSVVPIVVPPLRERRDDIPMLVQHFLAINRKNKLGNVGGISKEALGMLQRYAWPGNVRQLETVLKNASVFAEGEVLTATDLSSFPDIVGGASVDVDTRGGFSMSGKTLADLERMAIVSTLKELKGNKKKTAEVLGIDRRTLYNKLAAYGIAIDSDLKVR